ncbi:MAG: S8 family serine peptidase [Fimbriimonadaceae bacterium]|nr:S8 family serine peptidase [Fimbriimonadaceae bacterium]
MAAVCLLAIPIASDGQQLLQPASARRLAEAALEVNPNLQFSPYTLIVKFRPSASLIGRAAICRQFGGARIASIDSDPGLTIVSTLIDPRIVVDRLRQTPGVEFAELDQVVKADTLPNDASFGAQWGLNNTGQAGGKLDADIDAPEAWSLFTGNSGTAVAIIDTGIDLNHPDLAANIWRNPNEIPGNGIDDDGNGYVDDINGWNFVAGNNKPNDDSGHGTHCAGIIGAVGNNSIGVVGVNWKVKLVALKFLNASGNGLLSNATLAVDYCRKAGIKVSNNSWGGGNFSQAMSDALNTAKAMGHIFVAAAGNSGKDNDVFPVYPASYTNDNVLSVSSIDKKDARSSFSNYGLNSVDLAAPGSNITSTYLGGTYKSMSGTSMAAPHVAGAVALLYGFKPDWSYSQVRNTILTTVRVTSALNGKVATGGVLNIGNALVAAQGGGGGGGNTAPTVQIMSPGNGAAVALGSSVAFQGAANDSEDGNLNASIQWTSNIDGAIGTGGTLSTTSLSLGSHTIVASVTDSGGLTTVSSISLQVVLNQGPPAMPSGLTLNRVGNLARLTWHDNSGNELGFRIERQKKTSIFWNGTTTFNVNANSELFEQTPGTGTYRYRIQAFNSKGNSPWTGYATGSF